MSTCDEGFQRSDPCIHTLPQVLKKDLDVTVSVNDLVIKSAALALRDTPRVVSRWNAATQSVQDGQGKVDISVAVSQDILFAEVACMMNIL